MKTQSWFVGVDWATEEHAVCLIDEDGKVLGERAFAHSGTGLAEMCAWLLAKSGAKPAELHVAIETPHGAVVETLLERGIQVHSVNPKQLDRFRDRFTVAGAKDDRRDARALADSLRTDPRCFRLLQVDDATIIELREWSRIAEELGEERVRLGNRVREQLLRYYPQMLELADDVADDWFLALWELVPTPKRAPHVRERTIAQFLHERRIRRYDAKHVLSTLRQKPLTVAPGTTEAASAHIKTLVDRLRLVNQQIREAHGKLDELTGPPPEAKESEPGLKSEQRDVDILRSLPGVGRIVLAMLLAEASQPLGRADYHALRTLCGTAPVTHQTGKQGKKRGHKPVVLMRRACNMRLRNAVHYWSGVAIQHDPKSKAAYAALRARGHSHGRALRTIGDRLLALACAMLRDRTLYDESRRLAA